MNFDSEKIVEILLYISNKKPNIGFHQMSKVLYFADRKHLVRHGRTITGDSYFAMKDGPVPSETYDLLKALKSTSFNVLHEEAIKERIEVVHSYQIRPKDQADTDFLSETDIECLDESFEENKNLSYGQLVDKSHDYAWNRADMNNRMDIIDIAQEEGASEEFIQDLKEEVGINNALNSL